MIELRADMFDALDDPESLLDRLQIALALEHATIPTYLYAFYSVDSTRNPVHANVLRSIVREEMGHFALVCNLINALGGAPQINHPSFVPNYPGPLPGGIESGLQVRLGPLSRELLHGVFMKIEEPETTLHFPVQKVAFDTTTRPRTIGQFYARILQVLEAGGSALFVGDPSRQIATAQAGVPGIVPITDLASARAAIALIVDQGEGTTQSPEVNPNDASGADYAHYYKFAMLYQGRRLIRNPTATPDSPPDLKFIYGGDPIPLDPTGVLRVPVNPQAAQFSIEPTIKDPIDQFNRSYTRLLGQLHDAANGTPGLMAQATATMKLELGPQAAALVATPLPPSLIDALAPQGSPLCAAPTFEYLAD